MTASPTKRERENGRTASGCEACSNLVLLIACLRSYGQDYELIGSSSAPFSRQFVGRERPCRRAKTEGTKTRVATVAQRSPPITALPRGAFCSPPSPRR